MERCIKTEAFEQLKKTHQKLLFFQVVQDLGKEGEADETPTTSVRLIKPFYLLLRHCKTNL